MKILKVAKYRYFIMNFKQFYQINERTIGLTPEEISYVDILMKKIKNNCVPEFWKLGYAGLSSKSEDNFSGDGEGLVIHNFDDEPFPNLRISVYSFKKSLGSYHHEPTIRSIPYKRKISPIDYPEGGNFFAKSLKGKSIIEIMIPFAEAPEKLKWMEKNFITKFLVDVIRKNVLPKVEDLRNTLEHEIIHYKDPSIRIRDNRKTKEASTINYNDQGKGYYTSGGEVSGGVPDEFYPRIWTIIRNCEDIGNKKELISWIKSPVPILPKCMEKEREFVKYTWENPTLRRMFLRKLYDGIMRNISPGKF